LQISLLHSAYKNSKISLYAGHADFLFYWTGVLPVLSSINDTKIANGSVTLVRSVTLVLTYVIYVGTCNCWSLEPNNTVCWQYRGYVVFALCSL